MENKEYLGDGVYVTTDGYMLELTTENGTKTDNTIFLEPAVFTAFIAYAKRHIG